MKIALTKRQKELAKETRWDDIRQHLSLDYDNLDPEALKQSIDRNIDNIFRYGSTKQTILGYLPKSFTGFFEGHTPRVIMDAQRIRASPITEFEHKPRDDDSRLYRVSLRTDKESNDCGDYWNTVDTLITTSDFDEALRAICIE